MGLLIDPGGLNLFKNGDEMNEIIPVQPALEGEIDYCSCEAIGNEGHTFDCIMEQIRRKKLNNNSHVFVITDGDDNVR